MSTKLETRSATTHPTIKLVKETALGGLPAHFEHRKLLSSVLDRPEYLGNSGIVGTPEWYKLRQLGYVWFVGQAFVSRFKYAASVMRDHVVGSDESWLVYAGDVPDFALRNIAKAKSDGFSHFTIHSNKPLPIERIRMAPIDPVVVAWKKDPDIHKYRHGWIVKLHPWGVVIAAWDMDSEVRLGVQG